MAFKSNMLFDAMNNILTVKSREVMLRHFADENFKEFTAFTCRKYMSMSPDPRVRQLVLDNLEKLERLDQRGLYMWLMEKTPKQGNSFIRFLR